MLIRLLGKEVVKFGLDYDLIDVLRALSTYQCDAVITRSWFVTELDVHGYFGGGYGSEALRVLLRESGDDPFGASAVIAGDRLMAGAAMIHKTESGLFARLKNPSGPASLQLDFRLVLGSSELQAANVDLEIRCDEALPFEVATDQAEVVTFLQRAFAVTEVLTGLN